LCDICMTPVWDLYIRYVADICGGWQICGWRLANKTIKTMTGIFSPPPVPHRIVFNANFFSECFLGPVIYFCHTQRDLVEIHTSNSQIWPKAGRSNQTT
ncbi:MAG: hypothetical protein AAFQ13_12135, partial [Pseudomonadota bacterium]